MITGEEFAKYADYLTGEFDDDGWGILADDAPEEAKRAFEEAKRLDKQIHPEPNNKNEE